MTVAFVEDRRSFATVDLRTVAVSAQAVDNCSSWHSDCYNIGRVPAAVVVVVVVVVEIGLLDLVVAAVAGIVDVAAVRAAFVRTDRHL